MVDNQYFSSGSDFRIDLGCGAAKKEGFTGVDIFPYPGVDFVADLEKDLSFLPTWARLSIAEFVRTGSILQ